jgi:hypothetical protein
VIRELDDIPLPAQRGQVEVLVGAEQRIDPAAVRRVGVEDALTLTQEDAHPVRVHSRPDTEVVAFERRLVAPHEVVDDQLAAPVEQVGQASLANRPGEDVVLVDLDHRQARRCLSTLSFARLAAFSWAAETTLTGRPSERIVHADGPDLPLACRVADKLGCEHRGVPLPG